jgi:amino acid transporter
MGEICSTYPVAGSVYYWAGALSDKRFAPFASYITGWFNLAGNVANNSSFAQGLAQVISGLLYMMGLRKWTLREQVVASLVILVIWSIKNRLRIDHQGWFNNFSAIYQVLSTVLVVAVIFIYSPNLSSHDFVFTRFHNETGYTSTSYVSLLGLLMSLYGFSGYEGGATMAEETSNPSHSAPRGIIYSCLASGITGLLFIIAILYGAQGDIAGILKDEDSSDHAIVNIMNKVFQGD